MKRVQSVKAAPGYRLAIEFEDGVAGIIDLSPDLYGPVFEPLRDTRLFEQAQIDEFGVICWPNGADLAPEVLYDEILRTMSEAMKR